MDEACGSKGNILVSGEGCTAYDGEIFLARWLFGGQRHEDYETEYFNVYHHRDERGPRLRQLPDSKIVNVEELYTDVEKRNSPAYNEMLARSDTGNCLHARLDGPDDSWIVWTAADPVDDAGWSSQRVETVARILPHVRQFVRVRLALVNASFHPGGAGAQGTTRGCVRSRNRVQGVCLGQRGRPRSGACRPDASLARTASGVWTLVARRSPRPRMGD